MVVDRSRSGRWKFGRLSEDGSARRLLSGVLIGAVIAFLWKPVIRWVAMALLLTVGWGMVTNTARAFKTHGWGETADLGVLALQFDVEDILAVSRVRWTITNHGAAPVGEIVLSCEDGDGRVAETMLDIYVTSGSMAVGTFDDSDLSYDSICRIAAAKAFER